MLKRLTPVLIVDDLAASLAFWKGRLGFSVQVLVPEDPQGDPNGPPGFAILELGPVELMLQSRQSVENDVPAMLGDGPVGHDGVGLFVEVEGPLDPWLPKLDGLPVLVPRRQTFYGADEIGVRTPDGATLVLAAFGAAG